MRLRTIPLTWPVSSATLPLSQRFSCESITPFARPVVPPVYISAARSSSARSTIGDSPPDSSSANSSVEMTRAPGAASRAVSANSGVVITTRASESSTMCRSSCGGSRKIAGVTTAPTRQSAL